MMMRHVKPGPVYFVIIGTRETVTGLFLINKKKKHTHTEQKTYP